MIREGVRNFVVGRGRGKADKLDISKDFQKWKNLKFSPLSGNRHPSNVLTIDDKQHTPSLNDDFCIKNEHNKIHLLPCLYVPKECRNQLRKTNFLWTTGIFTYLVNSSTFLEKLEDFQLEIPQNARRDHIDWAVLKCCPINVKCLLIDQKSPRKFVFFADLY